jgi:RNA polymerase sigma factor (sigma-70 family)
MVATLDTPVAQPAVAPQPAHRDALALLSRPVAPTPLPATTAPPSAEPPAGPLDALSQLRRELPKGLLTAEQEVALARRMRGEDVVVPGPGPGRPTPREAHDRLVEQNMRLAMWLAQRYRNRGLPIEDLIQEGAVGLHRAAEKFDPDKGFRFSTYATWWVRQAMNRAIAEARAIRVPDDVEDWNSYQPLSLDEPMDEEGITIGDMVADEGTMPEDDVERSQLRIEVQSVLDGLSERERMVLTLRFGIGSEHARPAVEVGRTIGISRERVQQIEAMALARLRRNRKAHQLLAYVR